MTSVKRVRNTQVRSTSTLRKNLNFYVQIRELSIACLNMRAISPLMASKPQRLASMICERRSPWSLRWCKLIKDLFQTVFGIKYLTTCIFLGSNPLQWNSQAQLGSLWSAFGSWFALILYCILMEWLARQDIIPLFSLFHFPLLIFELSPLKFHCLVDIKVIYYHLLSAVTSQDCYEHYPSVYSLYQILWFFTYTCSLNE